MKSFTFFLFLTLPIAARAQRIPMNPQKVLKIDDYRIPKKLIPTLVASSAFRLDTTINFLYSSDTVNGKYYRYECSCLIGGHGDISGVLSETEMIRTKETHDSVFQEHSENNYLLNLSRVVMRCGNKDHNPKHECPIGDDACEIKNQNKFGCKDWFPSN